MEGIKPIKKIMINSNYQGKDDQVVTIIKDVADHFGAYVCGINNVSKHYTITDFSNSGLAGAQHYHEFMVGLLKLYDMLNVRISSYQYSWSYLNTFNFYTSITEAEAWQYESQLEAMRAKGHAHFQLTHNSGDQVDALPDENGYLRAQAPTISPSVITVGGCDEADTWCTLNNRTKGSNYGAMTDVVAPWINMPSHDTDGGRSLNVGTSYATPFAAGIGSLVFSINPDLTVDELQEILDTTNDPFGDVETGTKYYQTVSGRINAGKAVTKALTTRADNAGKVYPYCKFLNLWPTCDPNNIRHELDGTVIVDLNGYSTDPITNVTLSVAGEELYNGPPSDLELITNYDGTTRGEFIISASTATTTTEVYYPDILVTSATLNTAKFAVDDVTASTTIGTPTLSEKPRVNLRETKYTNEYAEITTIGGVPAQLTRAQGE
jgi:hypothetical protein